MHNNLKKRVKDAINKKLPDICGKNCPTVCCTPVITGNYLPKKIFMENNLENIQNYINSVIEETLNLKTKDGKEAFSLEGILISEIDTDNGFIDNSVIENMLLKKFDKSISQDKMNEYIFKIKEKFKELNVAIITTFSCKYYDKEQNGCSIYLTRPNLCISYSCEQLSLEKVNHSSKILMERLKLKIEQRDFILKNSKKNIIEVIENYQLENNLNIGYSTL